MIFLLLYLSWQQTNELQMINRRNFLRNTAVISTGTMMFPDSVFATAPLLMKVGIQFFSLPSLLEKDLASTFAMLSGMGYKEVELYGPYPFSTEGKVPLEIILDGTDPDLVFLEMDLFWTIAGGADPQAYLEKYKGRYRCMHVKDMSKLVRFSGDGGNAQQWIALFPFMTTAGNGILDLKTILTKAKASGVDHFFVEQDMVAEPETALKKSIDYLATL